MRFLPPPRLIAALLASALALISGVAAGQSVEVHLDRERVEESGSVQMEIRLEGDIAAIRGPMLDDWEVIGTSNSMRTSIVNGSMRKMRVIRKTLEPRRAGSLQIGETQALYRDRVVARAPGRTVQVVAPPPVRPRTASEASSLSSHRGEDAFILARPSTATPWEGQPFLLTFDLYLAQNLQVSNEHSDFPELAGFVVTNTLPPNESVQRTSRLGQKRYTVYTVKPDILVPLKPGRIVVEPLELHLVLGSLFQRQKVRVASDPFTLNVRPLPTANRPPGFRASNIGEFRLSLRLDKAEGKVGERRVATVDIQGIGNLRSLQPPEFPDVPGLGIERLDAVDTDQIKEDEKGVHGVISYSYLVTPERSGVHTLPPLTLAYFDPSAGTYRETSSRSMKIEASGDLVQTRVSRPIDTSGLKPLAESIGSPALLTRSPAPSPLYWGCLGALLLGLLGFEGARAWRTRRDSTADARRAENALGNASSLLEQAMLRGRAGDSTACHELIGSAMSTWILDRHAIQARGLTHASLQETLRARGHSPESASEVIAILGQCDQARYAPGESSPERMAPLVDATRSLLTRMQSESKGGRS